MSEGDIAAQLRQLLDGQSAQRDETAAGFRTLSADIALVSSELEIVKGRVGNVEERQNVTDEWRRNNSERVRGIASQTSQADLAHDAKLAAEIVARESLANKVDTLDAKQDTQLAILSRIEALTKHPIVKQIATAIGAAILMWLASKGIK